MSKTGNVNGEVVCVIAKIQGVCIIPYENLETI